MIWLKAMNFFIEVQLHEIYKRASVSRKKIEMIEKWLSYFYSKTMLVFAIKR